MRATSESPCKLPLHAGAAAVLVDIPVKAAVSAATRSKCLSSFLKKNSTEENDEVVMAATIPPATRRTVRGPRRRTTPSSRILVIIVVVMGGICQENEVHTVK
jgi:hypothetical protein